MARLTASRHGAALLTVGAALALAVGTASAAWAHDGWRSGQGQGRPHAHAAASDAADALGQGHRASVKGVVAASPAPSAAGFTLEVPGCATQQAISATSSTTYRDAETGVAATGVTVGERVIVTLSPNTTTLTAASVEILLARVSGIVQSKGSSSLVVRDPQGFDDAVDVSPATIYTPSGDNLGSISDGTEIVAFGTLDSTGTVLEAAVVHIAGNASEPAGPNRDGHDVVGVVAASPAPSAGGFSVTESDSTIVALVTNGSTRYLEPGAIGAPTGVTAGQHVAVHLLHDVTPPTAATVVIFLNQIDGTVSSVGTTSFVLVDHQGFSRTVKVDGATLYAPPGTTLAGLAGQHVSAFGNVDADLVSFDAQFVHVFATPAVDSDDVQRWDDEPSGCPSVPSTPNSHSDSESDTTTTAPAGASSHTVPDAAGFEHIRGTLKSVDTTSSTAVVTVDGNPVTVVITPSTAIWQGSQQVSLSALSSDVGSPVNVLATAGPGTEVTAKAFSVDTSAGGFGQAGDQGGGQGQRGPGGGQRGPGGGQSGPGGGQSGSGGHD